MSLVRDEGGEEYLCYVCIGGRPLIHVPGVDEGGGGICTMYIVGDVWSHM